MANRKLIRYRRLIGGATVLNLVMLAYGAITRQLSWSMVAVAFFAGLGVGVYVWMAETMKALGGWRETLDAWGGMIEQTKRAGEKLKADFEWVHPPTEEYLREKELWQATFNAANDKRTEMLRAGKSMAEVDAEWKRTIPAAWDRWLRAMAKENPWTKMDELADRMKAEREAN